MSNLVVCLNECKSTIYGIDSIVELKSENAAQERAIIKVCSHLNSNFKRILIEAISDGWWVVRFYRDDGSSVEKITVPNGSINQVMNYATIGTSVQSATIQ